MTAIRPKRIPQDIIDICNEIINTDMTEVNWDYKSSNKGLSITINYPDKSVITLEIVNMVILPKTPPVGPINRSVTTPVRVEFLRKLADLMGEYNCSMYADTVDDNINIALGDVRVFHNTLTKASNPVAQLLDAVNNPPSLNALENLKRD